MEQAIIISWIVMGVITAGEGLTTLLIALFGLKGDSDEEVFRRRAALGLLIGAFIGLLIITALLPCWISLYRLRPVVFIANIIIIFVIGNLSIYVVIPLGFKLYNPAFRNGLFIFINDSGILETHFSKYRHEKGRIVLATATPWGAFKRLLTGRKTIIQYSGKLQNTPKNIITINQQKFECDIFLVKIVNELADSQRKRDESEESLQMVFRERMGVELELAFISAEDYDRKYLEMVEQGIEKMVKQTDKATSDVYYWKNEAMLDWGFTLMELSTIIDRSVGKGIRTIVREIMKVKQDKKTPQQETQKEAKVET